MNWAIQLVNGTSFASPYVSGLLLLLFQANPDLTPEQARQILEKTAVRLKGIPDYKQGAGEVNPEAAVRLAEKMATQARRQGKERSIGTQTNDPPTARVPAPPQPNPPEPEQPEAGKPEAPPAVKPPPGSAPPLETIPEDTIAEKPESSEPTSSASLFRRHSLGGGFRRKDIPVGLSRQQAERS